MKHKKLLVLFFFIMFFFVVSFFWQLNWESPSQPVFSRRYVAILTEDTLQQNSLIEEGLQNAADELGVYVEVITISNFEDQSYEVYRALYSGFDGMIIAPIDNGEKDNQIFSDLTAASMPYIKLLDKVDYEEPTICLASDDSIAELAVQNLLDSGFTQKDSLHIFIGNGDDSVARNRALEFEKLVEQHGLSIDGTLTINVNIISSDDRIKEYIRDNHVNYIFCADALSTIAAAKCAHSVMYQRPLIIGCGFYNEHIEYFKDGTLQGLLCIEYEKMGSAALNYLDTYCRTGTVPEDYDLCITVYDHDHMEGQNYQWDSKAKSVKVLSEDSPVRLEEGSLRECS